MTGENNSQSQEQQGSLRSEGLPSYKRRRVALACTSCRHRKSRCNGSRPSCGLCVHLGFRCVYEQPSPTGLARGALTSSVQAAAGSVTDRLSAIEGTLQLLLSRGAESADEPAAANHHGHEDGHGDEGSPSIEIPPPPVHHNGDGEELATPDETPSGDMEGVIDGLGTMGDSEPHEAGFFGPSSNITFFRTVSEVASALLQSSGGSSTLPSGITSSIVSRSSSSTTTAAGRSSANMFSLPPQSKSLQLIMLFFSDAGIIFPMVDRPSFIQRYHDTRRNEFKAVQRPWLCLLNTIFAVASHTSKTEASLERGPESELFIWRAESLWEDTEPSAANLESGE
ncbi:hypothetical protein THARTR1_02791 [Trichoderma harzianum]|uniref:Zn(2)-C6 fungal-type domain-containing protein n=1 Tax=Trichoderma harzianum TaxID=5544 RepID=A0A2K0UHJ4_TRIHA|nr:hypothetical protein THARTR1_02791 [Trichoderma harzianum]